MIHGKMFMIFLDKTRGFGEQTRGLEETSFGIEKYIDGLFFRMCSKRISEYPAKPIHYLRCS
jgi:hypothetical protein